MAPSLMNAVVIDAESRLALQNVTRPELPEDGALIRVTGCGICGSDLDKLYHREPKPGLVLGHEVTGVIEALSEEAQKAFPQYQLGQRVSVAHHAECQTCYYCQHQSFSMCRQFKATNITPGGFSECIAVSQHHLAQTVFPLPGSISDKAGSCVEPLACCVRAVDRLPGNTGKTMLVIGLGFIGLMTSQYAQYLGYEVYGMDINPERSALAMNQEWLSQAFSEEVGLQDVLAQQTQGRGADVVFLSTVNPKTLDLALRSVRDGGVLMLFSSYGQSTPLLNQNELYFRELTVMTSYSPSSVHLKKAHDLIINNHIDVESLITHSYPLAQLPEAMGIYQQGKAIKVFITV
jgi:L-iditol 2-dehydrogenase